MAEVIQSAQQEFWRPPSSVVEGGPPALVLISGMAEACPRCSTEFLSGSHFCHSCGGRRPAALSAATQADAAAIAGLWENMVRSANVLLLGWRKIEFPSWLQYLHFHEIKKRVGLSTASLVAFIIGLACIAGALLVGLITAKTLIDWEAVQFYRAEWLLAATASFVAGILLKKRDSDSSQQGED